MIRLRVGRAGFTLIELLVSVGIISTLSSIVITAVNPTQQLKNATGVKRDTAAAGLEKSMTQYVIDFGVFPGDTTIPTGVNSADDICRNGVVDPSCINLDDVVSNYLPCIPRDQLESDANLTGFRVYQQNLRPHVVSLYSATGASATVGCEAPPEPIAHWKMDESSVAASLADAIGGFDLTTANVASPHGPSTDAPSVSFTDPYSFRFDGSDDYSSVTYDSTFDLRSGLTVSAWIKPESFSSSDTVNSIVRKGEANPNMWQMMIEDGFLTLQLEGGDGVNGVAQGATALSVDTWYHVAGTWDGTTASVYLDGTLDGQGSYSGSVGGLLATDSRDVYVGGRSGTDSFHGRLDDVRIFDEALASGHIARLANGKDL